MDKNLFLAVALSIAVYAAWFGFIEKKIAKSNGAVAAGQVASNGAPNGNATTSGNNATTNGNNGSAANGMPPSASGFADSKLTPAENDSIESASLGKASLGIRAHGAAIASWKFTGPRGVVELVQSANPGMLSTFPDLAFHRIGKPDELMFQAERPDKLRVIKEFLPGDSEATPPAPPRLRVTIENPTGAARDSGAWTLSVGPGLGTIPTEEKDNAKLTRALGLSKGEGGLAGKVDVFKTAGDHPADFRWVGVDNRYFLAALLPTEGEFEKVSSFDNHQVLLVAKSAAIAPHDRRVWEVPFYIGAKGQTWLSRYKLGLERSIDFGFFAQLGRIVLRVLDKIHSATGNWGWSIIILTMLIQTLMFPATYQSLKATTKMKLLQPEIAKLQQRHSKDPQRLNAEMMELYKKHGANPLGGCLPMLVQMPIFYALYTALRNAWELHGASWIFWIHDLSAKDPFYVLPLLMGGLMFAQNRMNPAVGGDPAQQQMMTFMPVIFTVMFLNFPSGLVLYWMTNSLVSAVAQLALKDHLALTPAKRA